MSVETEVIDLDTTAESISNIAVDLYIGDNEWKQLAQFYSYSAARKWVKSSNGSLQPGDRIRYVVISYTVAYEDNVPANYGA